MAIPAQLDFAAFSYGRAGGGLPNFRSINVYPETTPAGPKKSARLMRPGLVESYRVDNGPVSGGYSRADVFGGDRFSVSGTGVYREGVKLGTVPLGPFATFAASDTQLVITAGGQAWCYDGSTFEQIAIPDDKQVSCVLIIGSRFYFFVLADDEWYFSAIDDALTIDGLAFATADSAPDANVIGAILGDQVVFFGRETVEFWSQTGDQDAPLIRSQGSKYDKGCIAAASVVALDNRLMWVGSDLKVYTTGDVPQRISSHSVEALLSECAAPDACTAFGASVQGHDFYVLNIPGKGSWAFHVEQQANPEFAWSEWASWGLDNFRGRVAFVQGSETYIGDSLSGRVFRLDHDAFTDGSDPIETVVTVIAGRGICASIELDAAVGIGSEDGGEASVDLRYSDDKGRSWSSWRTATLGTFGAYNTRPRWTRLGTVRHQRVFELRSASNARVSYAGLYMNESQ